MVNYPYKKPGTALNDFRNNIMNFQEDVEGDFKEVYKRINNVFGDVTGLQWKEPVATYNSLPKDAKRQDARMVRRTGAVYRYDGKEWKEIQDINVGPVNEVDNRLTSELKSNYSELNNRMNSKPNKSEVRSDTNDQPINAKEFDTETKQLMTGGSVAVVGENSVGKENIKERAVNLTNLATESSEINGRDTEFIYNSEGKPTEIREVLNGVLFSSKKITYHPDGKPNTITLNRSDGEVRETFQYNDGKVTGSTKTHTRNVQKIVKESDIRTGILESAHNEYINLHVPVVREPGSPTQLIETAWMLDKDGNLIPQITHSQRENDDVGLSFYWGATNLSITFDKGTFASYEDAVDGITGMVIRYQEK